MPLNEAAGYRRSNLTPQQRQDAVRAIYGFQEQPLTPQLTQEQIDQMRAILAAHDTQPNQIKEFDLNKPPMKPYRYQEYPRAMYHSDGRVKNANNPDEMDAAIASGWAKEPPVAVQAEASDIDGDYSAEIAAIDGKLKKRK